MTDQQRDESRDMFVNELRFRLSTDPPNPTRYVPHADLVAAEEREEKLVRLICHFRSLLLIGPGGLRTRETHYWLRQLDDDARDIGVNLTELSNQ